MFHKLMPATDGSAHAEHASKAIIDLAQNLPDTEVTIVHVSEDIPSRSEIFQAGFDVKSILEADAHKSITRTEEAFTQAAVPYTLRVALGDPAQQIVELAAKLEIDLIVIGSRGLNKVSEMLLGSVSRKVTHDAHCPVMIVK